MDDLRILRDLGQELESEPPATLARRRETMYGRPRRRRTGWFTFSLAAAVTALAIAVPSVLVNSQSNTIDVLTSPRPAAAPGALNILVVGSDGERSGLLLVVQITADRKRAQVVTIPDDTTVTLPSCGGGKQGLITAAYAAGGLRCTRETVEKAVDVRVDHAVELGFAGLASMVDAVGGIEVTLAEPIDDARAKLHLKAGRQVLTGAQAVGYLRLPSGGEVTRQLTVLRALGTSARRHLTDAGRLAEFLRAAGSWVRTDDDFDPEAMQALALGLADTRIDYGSVPVKAAPGDPDRVLLVTEEARALFRRLE
ncbi:LCP family protein [Nonomuraea sp. NPDC050328]|uniref:LCP family protein n=1 Tax=Nonomuraea sp. NPDC050328 TaxID=3364361 RepID=UPI00379E9DA2